MEFKSESMFSSNQGLLLTNTLYQALRTSKATEKQSRYTSLSIVFYFYFRYFTLNPSAFTRFFVACSCHTSGQVRLLTSQYTAQQVVVPSGYCPSSYGLLLSHGVGSERVDVLDSTVRRQCNIPAGLLFTVQASTCPFRYCTS